LFLHVRYDECVSWLIYDVPLSCDPNKTDQSITIVAENEARLIGDDEGAVNSGRRIRPNPSGAPAAIRGFAFTSQRDTVKSVPTKRGVAYRLLGLRRRHPLSLAPCTVKGRTAALYDSPNLGVALPGRA